MTSNVVTSTWFHLGREEARQFYTRPMKIKNGTNKGGLGWSAATFNVVDWQAIAVALKGKPDTFNLWLSKQAIGGVRHKKEPCQNPRHTGQQVAPTVDQHTKTTITSVAALIPAGIGCSARMSDNLNLSSGSTTTTRLTQNWHSGFLTTSPPRPNTYGRPWAQHVTSYKGSCLQPGHYKLDGIPPWEVILENCSASIKLWHSHELQPHTCTMGQTASGAPNSNIPPTMAIPKFHIAPQDQR